MTVFSNVASNIVPGGPAILFHEKATNFVVKGAQRGFLLSGILNYAFIRNFYSTFNISPSYDSIFECGL